MRKFLIIFLLLASLTTAQAQKYACVNTDYIMRSVPEYNQALAKINKFIAEWQQELQNKQQEVDELRQQYQQEAYLLPDNLKQRRQDEIHNKESELRSLQQQRFGAGGDLDQKRAELLLRQVEWLHPMEVQGMIKALAPTRGLVSNKAVLAKNNLENINLKSKITNRTKMKKGFIVVLVALLAFGGSAMAQKNIKLGHINSNDLMQIMPGRDTAMALLQKEVEDLQTEMEEMKKEYETQVNNYLAKKDQLSELIRKSKESDIQKMAERIETFQANAQKLLEERQEALLKPIVDRAKAAIEEVGKENGYTYIFDAGVGTVLYSQDSDDIMPLVKKKLGLK